MDRIGTTESISTTNSTADRLVVLILLVAKGQIVHGSLGSGLNAEGRQYGIDDALAGFDISSHDGRW